jgi:23S rRNA pseudouridine2605 synthase
VASRRAADELIAAGAVLVNGRRPPASGLLIDADADVVTVNGHAVRPRPVHRYVLLNKPLGAVTTASDEHGRRTVLDVIGEAGTAKHRLFPVGRLDGDTTGLLLLTDDGDLAYRLTHPRYKVGKEYTADVAGVPTDADIKSLRDGVKLPDGLTAPATVELNRSWGRERAQLRIVIHEGRNRQVRRMLKAVGHTVVALRRTAFGPLRVNRMRTGEWRVLTDAEVKALRRAAGLV